uniref:Putative secreted protein n=1 Tax=Anopheles darlingi TaxID=43151 RepID=A0A2M4D4V7_ANODA
MTGCFLWVVMSVRWTCGSPQSEMSSLVSSESKFGLRQWVFLRPPTDPINTLFVETHMLYFGRRFPLAAGVALPPAVPEPDARCCCCCC